MAVVYRNSNLFCDNCGDEHKINYPLPVDEVIKKSKEFEKRHKNCKKTWEQPKPDYNKTPEERMKWWWDYCSRGQSSEAMWHCFMRTGKGFSNYPHDPDDFSRCYGLLEVVPELKSQMHKLKDLCPEWSRLVDNWDKLTEMFEENRRTEWKEADRIGMYEFMEKLLKV